MDIFKQVKDKLFGEDESKEVKSASDQSHEDQELAGFVKNKVEEVRSHANRIAHEGIWMTNIAYAMGFDSVFYDPSLKQYRPLDKSPRGNRRNRTRANLILPGMQNRLARMLKSPPKYDVRPNSQDQDDKDAAQLGMEVIGMVWDKEHINRKRIDLGMWIQQCGHAYIKTSWDTDAGEPVLDPETGELMGNDGDIRIEVVSAFECFPDPLAKTLEECSYFTQAKVRKLDYFRNHYPDRGDAVKEEGAWLLSTQYEQRINTLNTVGPASSGTQEQMKNAAIELSYYEKKSPKFPTGRHIIVANGVVLKNDVLPVGWIPFSKFDDVVIGGKYYSEALVTHARPLQDQYNKTLQKRSQWTDKLLAGKYIAARGHGLIQEAMNDQSGEVVEYDPVPNATEPHAMQLPTMPSYAYQESNDLKSELYEIMGLSEVSRGQLPSASIPAQGMQILLEQDETRIGIETEQHEHSWARVGQLILRFADKYYILDRKLKGRGKNLDYQVKNFKGEDLKKNFDAIVIRGSTIPNSKVMKRQEILNAFSQGLLGNPQDPAVRESVWGMMEFGDEAAAWEDYRVDMTQIQKTIKQIESEVIPLVDQKDNHPLHVLIKNRYRKSDKWDVLSPKSKAILEDDINKHVQALTLLLHPELANPPQMPPKPLTMGDMMKQQGQIPSQIPGQLPGQQGQPQPQAQ